MADLSRLSTADLKALQSGNLAGVSTDGLAALRGRVEQPAPQTVPVSAYTKFENMTPRDVVRNAAMGRIDKTEAQQYLKSIGSDPAMIDRFGEKKLSAFETVGGAVGQAAKGIPFVGTFTDEAAAAVGAVPTYVASQFTDTPMEYGAIREATQQKLREQADVFQKQNPYLSAGLQLAGGVGTGYRMLQGAPLSKALTLPGAAKNLATGALFGTAYGAGEGETPEMRADLAKDYGATGAVAGAVLPAALRAGGVGLKGAAKATGAVKRAFVGADADAVFADVISASKKAPEQLQREISQGKISTIADIAGDEVQGLTRAVGKVEGARNIIVDALEGRSEQAVKRVVSDLSKNVSNVDAYFGQIDDLAKARSTMAAPLYKEAFEANQVIVSKPIDNILATPTGKQALNRASRKMQDQMALLGKPDPVLSKQAKKISIASERGVAKGLNLQSLDYVKRGMDDMIGEAKRAGSADDVRILTSLKNQLVSELDAKDVTGKYPQARKVFSGFAQIQDAMEEGRKFKRMTPEQIKRTLKEMTPDQREAYRVGMRSALQDEVLKTADKADPAKRIFGNQFEREQLEAALGQKQFKDFQERMVEEIRAADTKFKVLGGSRTDINLAGDEQLKNTINQVAREGVRGTAVTRAIDFVADQIARRYYGINKANAQALAKALVDRKSGMEALQRLIDKQKGTQKTIVEKAVQGMSQFVTRNSDPNAPKSGGVLQDSKRSKLLSSRPEAGVVAGGLGLGMIRAGTSGGETEEYKPFDYDPNYVKNPDISPEYLSQIPTEVLKQNLKEMRSLEAYNVASAQAAQDVSQTFVIAEEGVHNNVYRDKMGLKTVGVGFNMEQNNAKAIWERAKIPEKFDRVFNGQQQLSNESARKLFDFTHKASSRAAQKIVPFYENLGVNQQAALDSMVFQLGPTGVRKFKNTLNALGKGNAKAVENAILNSLWAKQTPARAKRTALMLAYDLTPEAAERRLLEQGRVSARELKYN